MSIVNKRVFGTDLPDKVKAKMWFRRQMLDPDAAFTIQTVYDALNIKFPSILWREMGEDGKENVRLKKN